MTRLLFLAVFAECHGAPHAGSVPLAVRVVSRSAPVAVDHAESTQTGTPRPLDIFGVGRSADVTGTRIEGRRAAADYDAGSSGPSLSDARPVDADLRRGRKVTI